MAFTDILFNEGEKQNFVVEIAIGSAHLPTDILTETSNNRGIPCLETPLIVSSGTSSPDIIVLDGGQIAKKISDTVYVKI